MTNRLGRAREYLAQSQDKLEAIFITKPENRAYLSGFTGSAGYLLITADEAIIFVDGRYTEQATAQAAGWKVVRLIRPFEDIVSAEVKRLSIQRLGFESEHLTYVEFINWTEKLNFVRWLPTHSVVSNLRRLKDADEIANIRRAVDIADTAFAHILTFIKPGMTEVEVAMELEFTMRRNGADRIAFDTIVASGWRGALPHGRASDKVIEQGDFVTFDFGAHFNGYNSDVTRTIVVGEPSPRQREVYNWVLEAQLAGVQAVRAGIKCNEVDTVSRNVFEKVGQLDYFVHGLGHNLGREVHETPFLFQTDETVLEAGMVLTIEPGLYYPDWGGVRIEDDLLITETGSEVLPRTTKELLVIGC